MNAPPRLVGLLLRLRSDMLDGKVFPVRPNIEQRLGLPSLLEEKGEQSCSSRQL